MKKLVTVIPVIIVLITLVVTGCSNKGLIGPAPGTGDEAVSSCVTCHTDKDLLKELAVAEEEETSKATEGEG